jgi:hypothetical protein
MLSLLWIILFVEGTNMSKYILHVIVFGGFCCGLYGTEDKGSNGFVGPVACCDAVVLSHPAVPLCKTVHTKSSYEKKTVIGSDVFVERDEEDNGQVHQSWVMNGIAVNKQMYDDALGNAEIALLRQDREQEKRHRDREQKNRVQTVVCGYQKVLRTKIAQIEQWLQKINQNNLDVLLQFGPSTIASQQDLECLRKEVLPRAKEVVVEGVLVDLQAVCLQIDAIPNQLCDLFYTTAKHAITVCNDTKILRDLLTIVEQA